MNIRLDAAVVDSSALISIVKGESAADLFARERADVNRLYMSAATHAEVMLATLSIQHQAGILGMQRLLSELDVEIIDFGKSDLDLYLACAFQYHLKASPSGPLNMGDLFSFQLAMKMDLPLFFQGKDFLKTPVKNAMALLGYTMTENNLGIPTPSSLQVRVACQRAKTNNVKKAAAKSSIMMPKPPR